jgi:tRNA-modifying protein YgfZ
MNPDWKNHLLAVGAVIAQETVLHFGNPAAELRAAQGGNIVADLSHYGLIGFSGEDSQTFLQGQTTNDVRQVSRQQSQFGSLCTPQGRMLATFLLWRQGDDYFMELPAGLRESIQKHLGKYVMRAKVKVRDAGSEFVRLGVAGEGIGEVLQTVFADLPQAPYSAIDNEHGILIALPGKRYEIVAAPDQASALWQALRPACTPVCAACWDWLAIRAGMPAILPATQAQFTPQMANIELLGGVSFTKGCYTGQEVVARTQHLGKVKRRLYLAHIANDVAPQPGDALSGTEHGMIVNAQAAPDGGFDVLAVIPTEDAAAGNIRWKTADGALLQFQAMPYAVS